MAFTLSSSSLQDGGTVPEKHVFSSFGCTGGNLSPELHWSGAPAETKSFALTVYDPDAPTGSGWWHWTVVNIFTLHALKEPALPLSPDSPSAQVGYYLHFATIEKTSFTVFYGK